MPQTEKFVRNKGFIWFMVLKGRKFRKPHLVRFFLLVGTLQSPEVRQGIT
jgi:hypothetical protein